MMKEWVRNLTDKGIKEILTYKNIQIKVPENVNQSITKMILEKHYKKGGKSKVTPVKRYILAAVIFMIICIPAIFLITRNRGPDTLFLDKIVNHVEFNKNDNTILLSPGDTIKKGIKATTGTKSTCRMHYAAKSTVTIDENSIITLTEIDNKHILFTIGTGKMIVEEKSNKGARIEIRTPFAYVYAIGTLYSVEHFVTRKETVIKAFKGTLYIETIPGKEQINLKPGNEIIIKQDEQDRNNIEYSIKNIIKEWTVRALYYNSSLKEGITGFTLYNDIIIAVTEHSVIYLEQNEIVKEYILKDKTITSKPVIFAEKAYIPSTSGILCFNLQTGLKEPVINIKETTRSEYKITCHKNTLYVILTSGIYVIDVKTGLRTEKPVIPAFGAISPLFYENRAYVVSHITNNLEAYTITGEKLWSITLDEISTCTPVIMDNFLFVGTKGGTIYKIDENGTVINKMNTGENIIGISKDAQNHIYVQTSKNKLLKIDDNFMIKNIFNNVCTAIICDNNTLLTGTPYGSIKIIDITKNMEKEIKLSYNANVTSFIILENIIFAGLDNGYVLQLESE